MKFGYYTGWIPGLVLLVLSLPTWVSVSVIILGAIAPSVLSLVFLPSFGASFWDNNANFEFKSEKTAEEFLHLNSDASLKSDKPKSTVASLNEVEKSE